MDKRNLCLIVTLLLLSIFSQVTIADQPEGKGKEVNAVAPNPGYVALDPLPGTGQERAFCTVQGVCYYRTLTSRDMLVQSREGCRCQSWAEKTSIRHHHSIQLSARNAGSKDPQVWPQLDNLDKDINQ